MLQDFKDFINKGSFVDIAVAFVIGAAFATVVGAFTGRIVSPLIAMVADTGDMSGLWTFGEVDPETGQTAGSFGAFVEAALNFLIVAFVMFMVVRMYNAFKARNAEPEAPPADPEELMLLREIRDALQAR